MLKKISATAALAMLAISASAAPPNTFYAGVDGGDTKIHTSDGNEGSYGAFLGYNFHDNCAAEVGARRLGSWKLYGGDIDVNQYAASVIGTMPLANDFGVFARVGINRVEVEGHKPGFSAKETHKGGLFGLGVRYNFTPVLSARLEFQKPSGDSHNLSGGLAFQF
jgi:OOP family OmpA-OmpF porin